MFMTRDSYMSYAEPACLPAWASIKSNYCKPAALQRAHAIACGVTHTAGWWGSDCGVTWQISEEEMCMVAGQP